MNQLKFMIFMLVFALFHPNSNAGHMIELSCKKPILETSLLKKIKQIFTGEKSDSSSKVIIQKGLREGLTKSSAREKRSPERIYYSLESKRFVSVSAPSSWQGHGHVDLKYFINGDLMLPNCFGSKIKKDRVGIID